MLHTAPFKKDFGVEYFLLKMLNKGLNCFEVVYLPNMEKNNDDLFHSDFTEVHHNKDLFLSFLTRQLQLLIFNSVVLSLLKNERDFEFQDS